MTIISKTHTIKLKLWYMHGDKRGEITQYGHTQAVYRSSYGVSDDGEAPKKSLMDAIKKSLSMLGFCADVFMGQFDNLEYREQLEAEQAIEKAENRDAEIAKKREEMAEYVQRNLETLKQAKTMPEANGIFKATARALEYQKNITVLKDLADRGLKALAKEHELKKQELENV